jgi:hypothetical protein
VLAVSLSAVLAVSLIAGRELGFPPAGRRINRHPKDATAQLEGDIISLVSRACGPKGVPTHTARAIPGDDTTRMRLIGYPGHLSHPELPPCILARGVRVVCQWGPVHRQLPPARTWAQDAESLPTSDSTPPRRRRRYDLRLESGDTIHGVRVVRRLESVHRQPAPLTRQGRTEGAASRSPPRRPGPARPGPARSLSARPGRQREALSRQGRTKGAASRSLPRRPLCTTPSTRRRPGRRPSSHRGSG